MSASDAAVMADGYAPAFPRDRLLRLALKLASMIRVGTLTVVMPDGGRHTVSAGPCHSGHNPSGTVVLKDRRTVRKLITSGNIGLAEAYVEGWWESPDLAGVMEVASANEAEFLKLLEGQTMMRVMANVYHWLRPNTRKGARRNIIEHYDLGNEFYSAWLDPSMTYSSALFAHHNENLEAAQHRKIHRLCEMLRLEPGMRLLEIGCGWGAFAEIAARDYGCDVVGVTLSPSQLEFAQARIASAGLSDRVDLRLQDYRDVTGTFDRIASVEMFEAVGLAYWPTFFATVRERLRPGGLAGLQTITILDRLFDDYRRKADFIQRHIFPGGMLPSPQKLREQVARAGLSWQHDHWFGRDYAETLRRWQHSFQAAWPRIKNGTKLSTRPCDDRFKRLWEYYLTYCESGFEAGWTDVGQILLARDS